MELVNKYWPELLDPASKFHSTNLIIHAIIKELSELSDGYQCFPWSKPVEVDREYILDEINDLQHFVLELYIIWGVTSMNEVSKRYLEKRNKNLNERGKIHYTTTDEMKK